MNKRIVKKFRSKGYILRPESLSFIKQNLFQLETPNRSDGIDTVCTKSLNFLVETCQKHFHENNVNTNFIEPAMIKVVFSLCLDILGTS